MNIDKNYYLFLISTDGTCLQSPPVPGLDHRIVRNIIFFKCSSGSLLLPFSDIRYVEWVAVGAFFLKI